MALLGHEARETDQEDTLMVNEKTGSELIDEIAKEPSLDFFYDRNPKSLSHDEYVRLVEIERGKRAMFIQKKSK